MTQFAFCYVRMLTIFSFRVICESVALLPDRELTVYLTNAVGSAIIPIVCISLESVKWFRSTSINECKNTTYSTSSLCGYSLIYLCMHLAQHSVSEEVRSRADKLSVFKLATTRLSPRQKVRRFLMIIAVLCLRTIFICFVGNLKVTVI